MNRLNPWSVCALQPSLLLSVSHEGVCPGAPFAGPGGRRCLSRAQWVPTARPGPGGGAAVRRARTAGQPSPVGLNMAPTGRYRAPGAVAYGGCLAPLLQGPLVGRSGQWPASGVPPVRVANTCDMKSQQPVLPSIGIRGTAGESLGHFFCTDRRHGCDLGFGDQQDRPNPCLQVFATPEAKCGRQRVPPSQVGTYPALC